MEGELGEDRDAWCLLVVGCTPSNLGPLAGPSGVLEIVNGAVSGETISFQIVGTPANRRVTVTYTGRLSGGEIELTGQLLGDRPQRTGSRHLATSAR